MLFGRNNELKYLEGCYAEADSTLLVIYGSYGVGKSSLIKEFIKDKEADCFTARPGSPRRLLELWSDEINQKENAGVSAAYESIFAHSVSQLCNKKIIVIDEFQYFLMSDADFMDEIIKLKRQTYSEQPVMIVLISSDSYFIENELVAQIRNLALEINGFVKVKELGFLSLVRHFDGYSFEDALTVYSILGGIPGLWNYFDKNKPVKENICNLFLSANAPLGFFAQKLVTDKLREPEVYYTILSIMSKGVDKLNDLYRLSGYSRAKISVYLKNMMDCEIADKPLSVDTPGRANTKKGMYGIKNRLVNFYFRFIYPDLSAIEAMDGSDFYDTHIKDNLKSFCNNAYRDVCAEYLALLNKQKQLDINALVWGKWYGKSGNIDIIGRDADGNNILGFCFYEKEVLTLADFEQMESCIKNAKIDYCHMYIFSYGAFDKALVEMTEKDDSISLVDASKF